MIGTPSASSYRAGVVLVRGKAVVLCRLSVHTMTCYAHFITPPWSHSDTRGLSQSPWLTFIDCLLETERVQSEMLDSSLPPAWSYSTSSTSTHPHVSSEPPENRGPQRTKTQLWVTSDELSWALIKTVHSLMVGLAERTNIKGRFALIN